MPPLNQCKNDAAIETQINQYFLLNFNVLKFNDFMNKIPEQSLLSHVRPSTGVLSHIPNFPLLHYSPLQKQKQYKISISHTHTHTLSLSLPVTHVCIDKARGKKFPYLPLPNYVAQVAS